MTDHVYTKFTDQINRIRMLLQKDAAFREMCADYEELCTWLAAHKRSQAPSPEELDHAKELMQGLENEIAETLRHSWL